VNGPIAFVRPDENWELYSLFVIDPDGSHEHAVAGGVTRWSYVWSARDGKFLVSVGDNWSRPAEVNQDGSGLQLLDAYGDRKLHLTPAAWSPDGTRILVVSGAPDPHPDRPDANPADLGLYTVRATDGGGLRRMSSSPDRSTDLIFGSSADGSRVFVSRTPWAMQDAQDQPPTPENERTIVAIDTATGAEHRVTPSSVTVFAFGGLSADLSPDGATVAFAGEPMPNPEGVGNTIYLVGADGTGLRQLVSTDVGGVTVRWSPDGTRLAFTSKLRSGPQIWIVNADGSGLRQLTAGADGSTSVSPVWSPDGTMLLFQRKDGESVTLWTINADGTGERQLTTNPFGDFVGGYAWGAASAH
jgi:Tol biopolymer transport system component